MMAELRCPSKLHGVVDIDDGIVEIKCRSRFCGAQQGVVVLHRFKISTGDLVETTRYRDPGKGTQ